MTQPIDVAFVEVRFDTSGSSANLKKEVNQAFTGVEKSASQTAAHVTAEFEKAGESVSKTFRDVNGRLRDENGRFVKEGLTGFAKLGNGASDTGDRIGGVFSRIKSQIKDTFSDASSAASDLGKSLGAFSHAAGPLGAIVVALGLLGGAAVIASVAVQGLIVAAAGLALIPGFVLAAVGAFGVLAAATSGVGAAFKELNEQQKKQKTGGGGGISAAAEANRQRQLADALRGLTKAQLDLNKARQEALRDIERLNVELTRSRATQLRAADDLVKAEKLLEDTRKVGTAEQIKEATIAYEEAKAAVDEANQSTKELEQDKKKADKAGVEGSERVLNALEAIRDAQDRVKASQASLAAGFAGAAAAGTPAFDSLSKSAQGFVKAIFDAKTALGPLQDRIQEAFFKGTGDLVPGITANIKALEGPILGVAGAFNQAFTGLLKFLGSPEFKEAGKSVLTGLKDFIIAIGPGVKAVLKGFLGLGAQLGKTGKNGKTLAATLGDALGGALQKVGDFLAKVDLEKVLEDGKKAFEELKPIMNATFNVVKALFRFFEEHGPGLLQFVTPLISLFSLLIDVVTDLGIKFDNTVVKLEDGFLSARTKLGEFFTWARNKWNEFIENIKAIPNKISDLIGRIKEAGKKLIRGFFDGLAAGGAFIGSFAKSVANSIIRVFNDNIGKAINNAIQKLEDGINKIPGVNVNFPNFPRIPELEHGGLATQDTLARIGEKGKKEGVIPLENPRALNAIANAIAKAGGSVTDAGSGGITFAAGAVQVSFNGAVPTEMEAFRTGQAVGAGIVSTMTRQGIRTRVRTLGARNG